MRFVYKLAYILVVLAANVSLCVKAISYTEDGSLTKNVALDIEYSLVGKVIQVPLSSLRPTQKVIAHEQVNYKLAMYRNDRQTLFADLCKNAGWGKKVKFNASSLPNQPNSFQCLGAKENKKRRIDELKTVVLNANNELFLTDGHHTFSTFYDMPNGGGELIVSVYVEAKLNHANAANFWQQMVTQGKAWMYDANGSMIGYQNMPLVVGRASLSNDPYRAAAYFLRGGVWQKPKPAIAFVEFYWAQYLRTQEELKFPGYYTAADYIQWLERIHSHLLHLDKSQSIFGGYTAEQIGWKGNAKFSQVSSLLCDRQPTENKLGRLGIALLQRGMPVHCDSRQYLTRTQLDTGLLDMPKAINKDGSINALKLH